MIVINGIHDIGHLHYFEKKTTRAFTVLDSCHELMFTSEVNLELQMQTVHLMHF